MKNTFSLEDAKKFALEKFKDLKNKHPKGGRVSAENIELVLEAGVECGYKFGTKNKTVEDMPCNCDHLEPNSYETEHSKVHALLIELETGKLPKTYGTGYGKLDGQEVVYNSTNKKVLDAKTASLCKKLSGMNNSAIKKLSLEMQIWWRGHQEADRKKKEEVRKKVDEHNKKRHALSKLTDEERKLLGLWP